MHPLALRRLRPSERRLLQAKLRTRTLPVRRACSLRRQRVYVVMDNLNTHRHSILRAFCRTQWITVVPYPAYASWLHLIETHLDAMKRGMLNGSDDPSHVGRRWRTGDLRPRAESCRPPLLRHGAFPGSRRGLCSIFCRPGLAVDLRADVGG